MCILFKKNKNNNLISTTNVWFELMWKWHLFMVVLGIFIVCKLYKKCPVSVSHWWANGERRKNIVKCKRSLDVISCFLYTWLFLNMKKKMHFFSWQHKMLMFLFTKSCHLSKVFFRLLFKMWIVSHHLCEISTAWQWKQLKKHFVYRQLLPETEFFLFCLSLSHSSRYPPLT